MTDPDILVSAFIDPATGIYVERLRYSKRSAEIIGSETFWFAYTDASEDRNPLEGAPGRTPEEAIEKLLRRRPDLRRAA